MNENNTKADTLFNTYGGHQEKLIYYLFSIDATCLAFTITQSKTLKINFSLTPLCIAVIFWFLSFIWGFLSVKSTEKHLRKRILHYREIKTFINKDLIDSPLFEDFLIKTNKRTVAQAVLLGLGVLSFLIWHILSVS